MSLSNRAAPTRVSSAATSAQGLGADWSRARRLCGCAGYRVQLGGSFANAGARCDSFGRPSPTPAGSPSSCRGLAARLCLAFPEPNADVTGVMPSPNCQPTLNKGWSGGPLWDETALDLVRQTLPAPTVVARNLFDMSAVMWDAWAAYYPRRSATSSTTSSKQAMSPRPVTPPSATRPYHVLLDRYFQGQSDPDGLLAVPTCQLCYRFDYSRNRRTPCRRRNAASDLGGHQGRRRRRIQPGRRLRRQLLQAGQRSAQGRQVGRRR